MDAFISGQILEEKDQYQWLFCGTGLAKRRNHDELGQWSFVRLDVCIGGDYPFAEHIRIQAFSVFARSHATYKPKEVPLDLQSLQTNKV